MNAEKQLGQKLRGEKEVTLADGNVYKVFYSVNAIINLQSKHGSLQNVFKELGKGEAMDFAVLRSFLYQGIRTRHKEMTEEELGDLIDFFNFNEIVGSIFGGIEDALPPNEAQ